MAEIGAVAPQRREQPVRQQAALVAFKRENAIQRFPQAVAVQLGLLLWTERVAPGLGPAHRLHQVAIHEHLCEEPPGMMPRQRSEALELRTVPLGPFLVISRR